ncbi:hydroxyisourate hydrolase [Methylobacterium sp. J-072]|uniref:hydroxyisourate hydrolase n=1 Tax=Methylobacterium sp. J-072 TaxID=2836651 RepID=UPI001FB8F08E|nr:hydroxyisourate hydrolase [Methylobacterium sp. J-072]MCJ2096573.1 hydroxyisourate hydrolase [Methylobacterium sp. J-072]
MADASRDRQCPRHSGRRPRLRPVDPRRRRLPADQDGHHPGQWPPRRTAPVDDALKPGRYELLLPVEAYFAAPGVTLSSPNFLGLVPIRFQIRDARQHYHLPVLFTPWGYSEYRGS